MSVYNVGKFSFTSGHISFIKDVSSLTSKAAIAQLIGITLTPIITRLYQPDEFGVVSLFVTIGMVVGVLSALRYDAAVVLPKEETDARSLVFLSIAITVLFSVLGTMVVALMNWWRPDIMQAGTLGHWVFALPLAWACLGVINTLTTWCTRRKMYQSLGNSDIAVAVSSGATRIAAGVAFGSSILWLMLSAFLGYIVQIAMLSRRNGLKGLFGAGRPKQAELTALAKTYRDFPIYSAPTGLFNRLSQNLPVLLLGLLFAPSAVGFYAIANRLLKMPLSVVSLPLKRVYMQRVAEMRNDNRLLAGPLVRATFGALLVGFLPFTIVGVYGPALFGFVLGAQWATAGVYAAAIVPWLYSSFAFTPASSNFVILGRQRLWLQLQIFAGTTGGGAFLAAAFLEMQVENCLRLFSAVQTALNVLIFLIALRITMRADDQMRAGLPGKTVNKAAPAPAGDEGG